jgi:hypothetical protein
MPVSNHAERLAQASGGGPMRPLRLARFGGGRALPERRVDVRRLLIGLDGVMAMNAMAGAWYAVGGAPGVPIEWLDGTPFGDYVVPGLILGGAVGGSHVSAAVALWRGHPAAERISYGAGVVLLTWILIQLAMIGYVSPLQPIVLGWALATLVLTTRLEA